MGPIVCAETSVAIHQSTLRNISEEQRRHLNSGGSLKSRRIHSSLNFQASIVATTWNLLFRPCNTVTGVGVMWASAGDLKG